MKLFYFFLLFLINGSIAVLQASDNHDHHKSNTTIKISSAMAAKLNLQTAITRTQKLQQYTTVYGRLQLGPEQLSHVRARYSGLIQSVQPSIGDQVNQGDLLATVESNASLKTYPIFAPIKGTLIQRHANKGEVTQDQILFSIANFNTLWAEFRLYPTQQTQVKRQQPVSVATTHGSMTTKIEHIIPALDEPYTLARARIDNNSKTLSSGGLVEGQIIIGEYEVAIAINNKAIQQIEGQSGVFVQSGQTYQFTPIILGRRDHYFSEVVSGLAVGIPYVVNQSYLLKADLGKSSAGHQH